MHVCIYHYMYNMHMCIMCMCMCMCMYHCMCMYRCMCAWPSMPSGVTGGSTMPGTPSKFARKQRLVDVDTSLKAFGSSTRALRGESRQNLGLPWGCLGSALTVAEPRRNSGKDERRALGAVCASGDDGDAMVVVVVVVVRSLGGEGALAWLGLGLGLGLGIGLGYLQRQLRLG